MLFKGQLYTYTHTYTTVYDIHVVYIIDTYKHLHPFMLLLLLSHFSRVRLCATPEMAAHQAPRPWDSPGKNTGVGWHFLLQCMKVKSEREVAQLCLTLRDLMDCSLPGSSVHGIFQARVLEWSAIAFSTEMQYLDATSKTIEWSLFISKANHSISQ